MNRVRRYVPLIGFVLPTAVVGYGFVIPRSCIAGVNELTIGFGTTILGAVLTYFAGQRLVRPREACTKPPLRARLFGALNRQAASPNGCLGWLLGQIWRHEHASLNSEVLDQLDIREGNQILEIGFGPGHALARAVERAQSGRVVGVDISETMARLARRRNRRAISRGKLVVRREDIAALPLDGSNFDRIFCVHAIYFWPDADAVLATLAAALRPGGKLVLAFRPEAGDIPARFRDPSYRFPSTDQVQTTLERLGLVVDSMAPSTAEPSTLLLAARRR